METIFYISGGVAVLATLGMITRTRAVHALLYLIVSLLAVALVLFTLGAPFVAALEVILYAGAIMVLFVFVVMLLNPGRASEEQERRWLRGASWAGPAVLALVLAGELAYLLTSVGLPSGAPAVVPAGEVARELYGPYRIGVELASVLLLAALVGAFHIGRHHGGEGR
ncbi:MAG: NADH-quinone oxidoreductase subunit J [Acidobacteriota bacterium]|jgi:NADH-quinone oxidoreductase subunit J